MKIEEIQNWIDEKRQAYEDDGPSAMVFLNGLSCLEEAIAQASQEELRALEAVWVPNEWDIHNSKAFKDFTHSFSNWVFVGVVPSWVEEDEETNAQ